jgi:membrane-bound acyltransferase YfiQ involved in biofilm formation
MIVTVLIKSNFSTRWNLLSIAILISLSVFNSESTGKETLAAFLILLVLMTVSVHLYFLVDCVKRRYYTSGKPQTTAISVNTGGATATGAELNTAQLQVKILSVETRQPTTLA